MSAFTPAHLHKCIDARIPAALHAFGGIVGLANGLRSNPKAGLNADENALDGTVIVESILAAARANRPLEIITPHDNATTILMTVA